MNRFAFYTESDLDHKAPAPLVDQDSQQIDLYLSVFADLLSDALKGWQLALGLESIPQDMADRIQARIMREVRSSLESPYHDEFGRLEDEPGYAESTQPWLY